MANYTSYLNLTKPGLSDRADIQVINSNMDIIDTEASSHNSSIVTITQDISDIEDDIQTIHETIPASATYDSTTNALTFLNSDGASLFTVTLA